MTKPPSHFKCKNCGYKEVRGHFEGISVYDGKSLKAHWKCSRCKTLHDLNWEMTPEQYLRLTGVL